jgi:hypothetical protein
MAVTTTQIRDLLNRPRGLNEGTISEYITIRTAEVAKVLRSSSLFGATADNAPSTTLQESAIKMLVCVDCLTVMIDTIPTYYADLQDQRENDQRFRDQLRTFTQRAEDALSLVSEKGGAAFYVHQTNTRLEE